MLALGIHYLTGYAVATDVSDRERPEWPPHPARVFMAMAAALFETGEDADERAALEWLEKQGAPAMNVTDAESRSTVTHFVPPNDMDMPRNPATLKPAAVWDAMNLLPTYRRKKQPRTFPRARPLNDKIFLIWPDAEPDPALRSALDRLCDKVTRIGHSSSLVRMCVEGDPAAGTLEPAEFGRFRMRAVSPGTLDYLGSVFNREAIEAYAELQDRIAASKGKARDQLKKELAKQFGDSEPTSLRPTISQWQTYDHVRASTDRSDCSSGAFNSQIMVLTIDDGPVIGLEFAWRFLTALRDTILSKCDPTPEWLSGHTADGSPSAQAHLALAPLAFVDHQHADGHLLGVALVFPKGVEPRERGRALRGLLYAEDGRSKLINVKLGSLGAWSLARETRLSPPISLQDLTWTKPSDTWATITPIVLDHQPKTERAKDREQWSLEVAQIVAESCQRQGLPRPVSVDIDKTSWFRGSPRAVAGNGSGFPLMPVKQGRPMRQQTHAWLRFNEPVAGPLLIGAGRYRGYGFCRPWNGRSQ
jgi:CRISPR-associated protein Csb2